MPNRQGAFVIVVMIDIGGSSGRTIAKSVDPTRKASVIQFTQQVAAGEGSSSESPVDNVVAKRSTYTLSACV
jgi:hypothetical protein